MKVNNQNKLDTIISLLDFHIINELKKKDMNEDKVDTLTGIRTEFVVELNSVKRGQSISKMYNKKYWENYKKTNKW